MRWSRVNEGRPYDERSDRSNEGLKVHLCRQNETYGVANTVEPTRESGMQSYSCYFVCAERTGTDTAQYIPT